MDRLNLLIADDEPMIREGLATIIESFDLPLHIVAKAKNGLEALQLAKRHQPQLILTDICMPKLSGLDFIRALRQSHRETKIIILSGYGEFEYAREALQLGVSNYLLKPIQEEELRLSLLALLPTGSQQTLPNPSTLEKGSLVDQCFLLLQTHFSDPNFDLSALAQKLAIHPDYLSRKLKTETGFSFKDWLSSLRIQKALELLKSGHYSMAEIAEQVGYSSQHYFSTVFKHYTGQSPTRHQEIDYEKL